MAKLERLPHAIDLTTKKAKHGLLCRNKILVRCTKCGWEGRRTQRFLTDLSTTTRTIDSVSLNATVRGKQHAQSCPKCVGVVVGIIVYPNQRV